MKFYILILIIGCSFLTFAYKVVGQTPDVISTTTPEIQYEALKAPIGNIIQHTQDGDIINYAFISNNTVNNDNIVFIGNDKYSNVEKVGENYIFYARDKWYKDNGQIRTIETATTDVNSWENANKTTLIQKILAFLSSRIARADDFYASNDHSIGGNNATWATIHNAASATINYGATSIVRAGKVIATYYIDRAFIQFDTSFIQDKTINAGFLSVWITAITANSRQYAVVESTISDPLAATDYASAGTTLFSSVIVDADMVAGERSKFDLLAAGKTAINKTGKTNYALRDITKDAQNTAPADNGSITFYNSTQAGTSYDPYLVLNLSEATTTAFTTSCVIPTNYDLSIITGCKEIYTTSSTSASSVEKSYFYIPFTLYLFVYSLFIVSLIIVYIIFFIYKE